MVIPVGLTTKSTKEQRDTINKGAKEIEQRLFKADLRVAGDYRDNYSPGWKFADAELKGIPLRVEFGPKDQAAGQVLAVRRDTGAKFTIKLDELETRVPEILETIQKDLLEKARKDFDSHRVVVEDWKDFVHTLNNKNVILSPWCGVPECEDDIKESSASTGDDEEQDERAPSMGAKSLCIPGHQLPLRPGQKCVRCTRNAVTWCMFGRSY